MLEPAERSPTAPGEFHTFLGAGADEVGARGSRATKEGDMTQGSVGRGVRVAVMAGLIAAGFLCGSKAVQAPLGG